MKHEAEQFQLLFPDLEIENTAKITIPSKEDLLKKLSSLLLEKERTNLHILILQKDKQNLNAKISELAQEMDSAIAAFASKGIQVSNMDYEEEFDLTLTEVVLNVIEKLNLQESLLGKYLI